MCLVHSCCRISFVCGGKFNSFLFISDTIAHRIWASEIISPYFNSCPSFFIYIPHSFTPPRFILQGIPDIMSFSSITFIVYLLKIWHVYTQAHECMLSHSGMSNSVNQWTVVHQTPLSMEFLWQEYWSGLPFPTPGDLPDLAIEPPSCVLAGGFSISAPPGKP